MLHHMRRYGDSLWRQAIEKETNDDDSNIHSRVQSAVERRWWRYLQAVSRLYQLLDDDLRLRLCASNSSTSNSNNSNNGNNNKSWEALCAKFEQRHEDAVSTVMHWMTRDDSELLPPDNDEAGASMTSWSLWHWLQVQQQLPAAAHQPTANTIPSGALIHVQQQQQPHVNASVSWSFSPTFWWVWWQITSRFDVCQPRVESRTRVGLTPIDCLLAWNSGHHPLQSSSSSSHSLPSILSPILPEALSRSTDGWKRDWYWKEYFPGLEASQWQLLSAVRGGEFHCQQCGRRWSLDSSQSNVSCEDLTAVSWETRFQVFCPRCETLCLPCSLYL